jgi:chaperonin GroES
VEPRLGDAARWRRDRRAPRLQAAGAGLTFGALVPECQIFTCPAARRCYLSCRWHSWLESAKPGRSGKRLQNGVSALDPDTAKEKPQKGKVVAVGDGAINEDGSRRPLDVAEGDEVLYSKYGGTEVTVEGDDLLVLRESDVLAKVG